MNTQEYWHSLCEQISSEKDSERLIELVEKLNRALEERETADRIEFGPDRRMLDS